MLKQILLTTSLLLTLYSCGNQGQSPLETVSGNIYYGTPVKDNKWDSTVSLTHKNKGSFCSGTLISKQVVVTAAHCLNKYDEASIKNISIYVGNGHPLGYQGQYKIMRWNIHPDYRADKKGKYDFAYIILEKEVKEKVSILPLLTDSYDALEVYNPKNKVTLVGFGKTERWITGVKHEVETTISEVTDINFQNFDLSGRTSCFGDSGGPAFYTLENGKTQLVGIASAGIADKSIGGSGIYVISMSQGDCSGLNLYGRTDTFMEWFKTTEDGEAFLNKSPIEKGMDLLKKIITFDTF